ncbi:MAG: N,N-dimethylformamidase beta subunit family domain-containing protein, partial [Acetobacteraceae bacterium]
MNETELPVTGYLDRFSYRPGDRLTAHVSARDGGSVRARLLRVISGDPNPAGPGLQLQDLSSRLDQTVQAHHQPIALGSYAIVDRAPARDPRRACTWTVLVCPGIAREPMTVLAETTTGGHAVILRIGGDGVHASVAWPGGSAACAAAAPVHAGTWYRAWVSADPAAGRVLAGIQKLDGGTPVTAEANAAGLVLPAGGTVMIAADTPSSPARHFTGKLEDPAILFGVVANWRDPRCALADLRADLLAGWDFSREIPSQGIIDAGPHACHGHLVNLPTRAVVGARWTGVEMCWRHAPTEYGAIHFHADDLGDCGWQPSFTWAVPDDLASGAYALHLTAEGGQDWLPFYVLPKRQGPFAPIAFLASTFTYQAYANHARDSADADYHARVAAWGAYPYNPDQHPLYGRSMYNVHLDGSGISFSSRRRPILTMRPGFLTFNDPAGSGLRHYPADTHLLAWLEAKGQPFDVITDEDLDDEGVALLKPYRAVLTGSHPEYHTSGTLDALAAYTRDGGRLAYLGG